MIQPPYSEDKMNLPVGLYVQRVYTELKEGSQNVSMVLRNGMGKPIHLVAGRPIGQVVAANAIPDAIPSPELEAKLQQGVEKPKPLMTAQ